MHLTLSFLMANLALQTGAQQQTPKPDSEEPWGRVLALLLYVSSDYPEALSENELAELEEQSALTLLAEQWVVENAGPTHPALKALRALRRLIAQKADAEKVARHAEKLVEGLIRERNLSRIPSRPPDLERGKALFAQACQQCHESAPGQKPELAVAMRPPPASFFAPDVMDGMTPFKAFILTTHGVHGTAMPAFSLLPTEDRWSLAFFISSLRHGACKEHPPRPPLAELATLTDPELAVRYGRSALPCLRRQVQ